MPSDKHTAGEHPLKVTSPRLEKDEFRLTPCGRPDRRDARELDPSSYSTPTRAVYEPDSEVVEQTEQADLMETVAATDGGDDADD